MKIEETVEVKVLYEGVKQILGTVDHLHGPVGNCKCGVYLFYDYDGEPIYIG